MRLFDDGIQTPGQLGQPWQVGDIFAFGHGPYTYAFRVIRVEPDGSFWRGDGATEMLLPGEFESARRAAS